MENIEKETKNKTKEQTRKNFNEKNGDTKGGEGIQSLKRTKE